MNELADCDAVIMLRLSLEVMRHKMRKVTLLVGSGINVLSFSEIQYCDRPDRLDKIPEFPIDKTEHPNLH
jgi:hypothetical protein